MTTSRSQSGILAPLAALGISLTFQVRFDADPRGSLLRLRNGFDPTWGVVGVGLPLVQALHIEVPGLRAFPAMTGPSCAVPATQQALWVMLLGEDRGELFDQRQQVKAFLHEGFELDQSQSVDTFRYAGGRDLTGYEDGTENPTGDEAAEVALVAEGDGMAASSFAAVQRWQHDLMHFHSHAPEACDHMIGRQRESNEELDDAPESAHVKRSAQERFAPEAFMLRRSMPWATTLEQGLLFIAYGHSLSAYEQVLTRMVGSDDGIVDALFRFSRPITGGYYWCPPVADGKLDFSLLGF